jgi:hypothetical protein
MSKYLIFDSGALINLSQNSLLTIFREIKNIFEGEFLITPEVKYETISHPLKIKRFEWGAMRIDSLVQEKILKIPFDEKIINEAELKEKTEEVLNIANTLFTAKEKNIHLIERGEAECMALSLILSKRGIENLAVIDERTARMLCENVENLKEIMESKLNMKIKINPARVSLFKNIKVIRSTELIYIAYLKKLPNTDNDKLEAMLYALKYGGCSISEKEIEIMKKL